MPVLFTVLAFSDFIITIIFTFYFLHEAYCVYSVYRLNKIKIKSSHLQNSQYHSAIIFIWPRIYSASSRSQHTLFTLCHSHQTIVITQTHSLLLPTCFTSSLEPTSYVTQNSSSKLFIPVSASFIWTCRFNLLYTAITFHRFLTVSLWAQNLPFQKI